MKKSTVIVLVANIAGCLFCLHGVGGILSLAKAEQRSHFDGFDSITFLCTVAPVILLCFLMNLGWGVKALADIIRRKNYQASISFMVVLIFWIASFLIMRQASVFPVIPSGWDKYADSLTTSQPKPEEIFGGYRLIEQTVTTNGLAVLQGRQCGLKLSPVGVFSITNFPIVDLPGDQLDGFLSATGRWECDTVSFTHGQPVWGIRFAETDPRMDLMCFMGKQAPYRLMMTYGDPDENRGVIFEKK